jgi:hypothetical protein
LSVQEARVDTLVDPVEVLPSSSHLLVAEPSGVDVPPPPPLRGSLPSLDPDAQVQWFSRVFEEEPPSCVDVEVLWDEESDTEPTLVLRKRAH